MPTLLTAVDASQTATLTTEHTLYEATANYNFVLVVDTVNMVNGDVTELKIYTKTLATSTAAVAYYAAYAHAQAQPVKYSVPVPANIYFKATLKQKEGTAGRAYPFAVLSVT